MLRQVKVENGLLEGLPAADPRITAFKGIPFAAPPVGKLRWKAPQPAENWEGIRKAYTFGPISMQEIPGQDPKDLYTREWHVDPAIPMSEDSLYLNVWTPAKSADEKLPVMVWFYGGAFNSGYTAEMEFDGERIARRGVILVSVAYRLNVFAWFAHPELTAENPGGPAGNFGFLDQMAGLQWVQRNIAAFGGDPDNVTIFGQSAGGGSVLAHLVSPLTGGLFHKAIVMSAGGIRPANSRPNNTLAEAEAIGLRFQKFLGAGSLAEMREIDSVTLRDRYLEFSKLPDTPRFPFTHFTDGYFLDRDWTEAMLQNKRHMVPILAGHTTNDFRWPPMGVHDLDSLQAYARREFGDKAAQFLSIVDFDSGDYEKVMKNVCYPIQELGSAIWEEKNARLGNPPIYGYTFDAEMPGDDAGAFHSSDLWFVFETLAKCWRPFTGKHYDLARRMCNYWTNFAKTGDPNGPDQDGTPMPVWEPYTLEKPYEMYLGDTVHMRQEQDPLIRFLVDYAIDWHEEHPYCSK
ncbi:MAG: carboxylesterase family protein [Firmicutes bacterium]|nr:carboxylesterase family protein [Bacillota bacterium]